MTYVFTLYNIQQIEEKGMQVKLLHPNAKVPEFNGFGFDIFSGVKDCEYIDIRNKRITYIPTGISVQHRRMGVCLMFILNQSFAYETCSNLITSPHMLSPNDDAEIVITLERNFNEFLIRVKNGTKLGTIIPITYEFTDRIEVVNNFNDEQILDDSNIKRLYL